VIIVDTTITITSASADDVTCIQDLFHRMFLVYNKDQDTNYPHSTDGSNYLRARISDGLCFLALLESNVIGFITGSINTALPFKTYREYGFIENLFVLEDHRRKGAGKLLVNRLVDHFKESGITHILTDSENSPHLKSFFESVGFDIVGINYELSF
jgi:GNAT superfamily N-acetyltransferase